ncbi:MAG: hypothetical protein ACNA8L_06765 [Luteolibacter sp.]
MDIETFIANGALGGDGVDPLNYVLFFGPQFSTPTALATIFPASPSGPMLENPLLAMVEQIDKQPDSTPDTDPLFTVSYQEVDSDEDINEDEEESQDKNDSVVIYVVDNGINLNQDATGQQDSAAGTE